MPKNNKTKYAGLILDGRWEITKTAPKLNKNDRRVRYVLKNIYNNRTMIIDNHQLKRIRNGESSVSKIIARRIAVGKEEQL